MAADRVVRIAANPGRWLRLEGVLAIEGEHVTLGGRPLAELIAGAYVAELDELLLARGGEFIVGDVVLELQPASSAGPRFGRGPRT